MGPSCDGLDLVPLYSDSIIETSFEVLPVLWFCVQLTGQVVYMADHLIRTLVSEHPGKGRVCTDQEAIGGSLEYAFCNIFKDVTVFLFTCPKRLRCLVAFLHVMGGSNAGSREVIAREIQTSIHRLRRTLPKLSTVRPFDARYNGCRTKDQRQGVDQ